MIFSECLYLKPRYHIFTFVSYLHSTNSFFMIRNFRNSAVRGIDSPAKHKADGLWCQLRDKGTMTVAILGSGASAKCLPRCKDPIDSPTPISSHLTPVITEDPLVQKFLKVMQSNYLRENWRMRAAACRLVTCNLQPYPVTSNELDNRRELQQAVHFFISDPSREKKCGLTRQF